MKLIGVLAYKYSRATEARRPLWLGEYYQALTLLPLGYKRGNDIVELLQSFHDDFGIARFYQRHPRIVLEIDLDYAEQTPLNEWDTRNQDCVPEIAVLASVGQKSGGRFTTKHHRTEGVVDIGTHECTCHRSTEQVVVGLL